MLRFFAAIGLWPQRGLIGLVRGYRFFLSPWLGSACRFTPTCSAYSLQALETHGAVVGSYLTVHRLVRCHPWCDGGQDLVPLQGRGLFSRHVAGTSSLFGKLPFLSSLMSSFTSRKKTLP